MARAAAGGRGYAYRQEKVLPARASVGERHALSQSKSPWEERPNDPVAATMRDGGCEQVRVATRRVGDGTLVVIVSHDPPPAAQPGWHLSISFRDHRGQYSRYPRWDEIAQARYELLPPDLYMCMILPPPENYVSHHDSTFQLHEHVSP